MNRGPFIEETENDSVSARKGRQRFEGRERMLVSQKLLVKRKLHSWLKQAIARFENWPGRSMSVTAMLSQPWSRENHLLSGVATTDSSRLQMESPGAPMASAASVAEVGVGNATGFGSSMLLRLSGPFV